MYRKKEAADQSEFIDFHMKFGGKLNPDNRWIRLARLIPWDLYEDAYAGLFPSDTGAPAKPFRMALGALLIKTIKRLSDQEVVEEIRENPYLQYLIGLEAYQDEAPFDASTMVLFRKRISADVLNEINADIVRRQIVAAETGDEQKQPKKRTKQTKPKNQKKHASDDTGLDATDDTDDAEAAPDGSGGSERSGGTVSL